jgi:hypothetical protein
MVTTSRRKKWEGHLEHVIDEKYMTNFNWKTSMQREHLEDPGTDGRIVLKGILKTQSVRIWTRLKGLRVGSNGRFLYKQ